MYNAYDPFLEGYMTHLMQPPSEQNTYRCPIGSQCPRFKACLTYSVTNHKTIQNTKS